MDDVTSGSSAKLMNEATEIAARAYGTYHQLVKLFTDEFRSGGVYAVKHRQKDANDIAEKVERKRASGLKYEAKNVKDVIGVRFVTLFQASIPDVLEYLLKFLLDQKGEIAIGPNAITEIEPYSNRHENDPLSIDAHVRLAVDRNGLTKRLLDTRTSRSGYSSVHLVIQPRVKLKSSTVSTFLEIQIRSVLEDAWSEISHRAAYAAGRSTQILEGIDIEPPQAVHLNVLKSVVDASIQYADVISDSLGGAAFRMGTLGLTRVRDYVPSDIHEEVSKQAPIIRMLFQEAEDRLERAFSANLTSDRLRFLALAADRFEECRTQIDNSLPASHSLRKAILRFLDMERGLCLNLARTREQNEQAIQIFKKIVDDEPSDPVGLYRLGSALSDSRQYDEGLTKMEAALAKIESSDSALYPDWLNSVLPRNLALRYWRASETLSGAERVARLVQAYETGRKGLDREVSDNKRDHNSLQNVIYYTTMLAEDAHSDEKTQWLKKLRQHVDDWQKHFEHLVQNEMLDLHTLALAYEQLSEYHRAAKLAKRVLFLFSRSSDGLLLSRSGEVLGQLMERILNEDERKMLRDCWRLLKADANKT